MNLLALECAGSSCSVALSVDGNITQRIEQVASQQHSQHLLPMQHSLLEEAGLLLQDLDLIVCGHGPGSFTGVRVAVAVAQGLAYGAKRPAMGVSSLAAMAWGASHQYRGPQVLVAMDARMQEVYWGRYAFVDDAMQVLAADSLDTPASLAVQNLSDQLLIGNAWSIHANSLGNTVNAGVKLVPDYPQQASDVAGLAAALIACGQASPAAADHLQPVYLRNKVTG